MKLYKFYADWCQPCKAQTKLLEDLNENIEIIPINIEEESSSELCEKYGVRSLPTLVLVDEFGGDLKIWHGVTHPKEISEAIDELEKADTEE
ncbi:thioredoxin family protein [Lachnospira sp.]|jgi:thioredoxin 1|uniref:thioredoxin family protein n=1 Tax=Lachnospira sp. TaxID=2049031 RepID=UPI0025798A38|nr:thioredoxin family protein [Lachnospira sp.]